MTKKITEFKLRNEIYFEFVNLNYYDDFDLTSDIIRNDIKANEIDEKVIPGWSMSRTFELNDLKFQLIVSDEFPMDLKLLEQNKEDNHLLRQLANKILSIIKAKSNRYKPVRRKK